MPIYTYDCEPCKNEFDQFFPAFSDAKNHMKSYACPDCEQPAPRILASGSPSVTFKGHFPGERVKQVDARKRRQAKRLDIKVKNGEMTPNQVDAMAKMRDKYSTQSPYTMDPTKDGKQDPNPSEPSTGYFDHEQEV